RAAPLVARPAWALVAPRPFARGRTGREFLLRMDRTGRVAYRMGRLLSHREPGGIDAALAPSPRRALSVAADAGSSAHPHGFHASLVCVFMVGGGAKLWTHGRRALAPAMAGAALLVLAQSGFLEQHSRACDAAQLPLVHKRRRFRRARLACLDD